MIFILNAGKNKSTKSQEFHLPTFFHLSIRQRILKICGVLTSIPCKRAAFRYIFSQQGHTPVIYWMKGKHTPMTLSTTQLDYSDLTCDCWPRLFSAAASGQLNSVNIQATNDITALYFKLYLHQKTTFKPLLKGADIYPMLLQLCSQHRFQEQMINLRKNRCVHLTWISLQHSLTDTVYSSRQLKIGQILDIINYTSCNRWTLCKKCEP